jgi:hypothetical protein
MNYEELADFIETRMRMSHIYQPVMILALLEHQGRCDEREIAKSLLAQRLPGGVGESNKGGETHRTFGA